METIPAARYARALIILGLLAYTALVVRNAWLSDDAYITFRTVDNFVHGYGLTWNVAERVQTYTHPLWMFLLAGAYALTGEIYFTSLLLSIAISVGAAILLVRTVPTRWQAAVVAGILACSKAAVDYATSGLENPLTHLLLVGFLALYVRGDFASRRLFWLALLAALGMTNRMDTALLYTPALLYAWASSAERGKGLLALALGGLPFALWEGFSLLYYGFPFPNTAYAKLNAGLIARRALVQAGLAYLHNSLRADPVTLTVIGAGAAATTTRRAWRRIPVTAGVALYLAYVVYVGGDFMSGRFLSAPLIATLAALPPTRLPPSTRPRLGTVCIAAVVALSAASPFSPLRAGGAQGGRTGFERGWVRGRGIIDERANYYHNTGLLRALTLPPGTLPDHDWALEGRAARAAGPSVVVKGSVGFFGYFAGPEVYVVDLLGLGNALLARLPPAESDWVVGHFGRVMPEGYVASLEKGENRLADPNLARYYDALMLVIRGPLFDAARLRAIWAFNTGRYDALRDAYAYFRGTPFVRHLRLVNPTDRPYVYAYAWNNGRGEVWLLDEASQRGKSYEVTWRVTEEGVTFEGEAVQRLSTLGPLSDAEPLNVGVIFSPAPDLAVREMYEYRYWFRLEPAGSLTVVLPPTGWHTADAAQGYWERTDVRAVMAASP